MATSSRQSNLFGVNDWKKIYQTYNQADFQSYDFETLRKSFIDYLRAYYPETFNDYTESSEFVALLDLMAFMGQAISFRDDLNTRENFIDTAQRKDSIVKLANLVGYTPKRNTAAQGLLKITSIQTTESISDINGINLSNLPVLFNDPANPNWQEQFNTIVNATLVNNQRIGKPGNSQMLLDIKTDEYGIAIPDGEIPAGTFSARVNNTNMNFEYVSVTSINSNSLYEIGPQPTNTFNILYRNDRLGYGSVNTGFFMYFKQGSLQEYFFSITEQTVNNVVKIGTYTGVNNSDTWLYEIDPVTGMYTQWTQVDNIYNTQNGSVIGSQRKVFSVTSGFNDSVSFNFGDGVFSKIPVGNFVALIRTSNGQTYTITPTELRGIPITFNYVSKYNRIETLSLTLSLQTAISNAQSAETNNEIKSRAPQNFYTQNRMVNGEDYNSFPFTLYNSILKSKALNRVSVGTSRNYDLLDPSAKYSSTNDFADDGGLYLDNTPGFVNFTSTGNSDVVSFFTTTLANILAGHRAQQYYIQNYPWVQFTVTDINSLYYWEQASRDNNQTTGFFYNKVGPRSVGVNSSGNVQFITEGALIRFVAPSGYYFDQNNLLVEGIPSPSDIFYIWANVVSVEGDGSNYGSGFLSDGTGPVVLSTFVPNGCRITAVIPSFTNVIGATVIENAVSQIGLNNNFGLKYNNSLTANVNRWSLSSYTDVDNFVKFQSLGNNSYLVTYNSLAYYFASATEVRFSFDQGKVIYDPLSGKVMQDTITILKSNSQPINNNPISKDIKLYVVGQPTESDGYPDDYSVEVSTMNGSLTDVIRDPNFFDQVTNYVTGINNYKYFVFFQQIVDANLLSRYVMIPSSSVVYNYGSRADIEALKYQFPVGTIFFAPFDNKFYTTQRDITYANIYTVTEVTNYMAKIGRQGLYFQYQHISGDTTRINPATTNIIDLYLVTSDYYTNYINYITDTTGTVMEPDVPTLEELTTMYSNLNNFKMLTDNIIMNSVKFKPLFGSKADSSLQATIKVIKNVGTTASDSEITTSVLGEINNYFNIENWNFGDTFYFSELSAYLHSVLGDYVSSVVLVPKDPNLVFGDLYEIRSAPYEIFVNCALATDIVVITSLTPSVLQTG